jgi:hypothetical protein
VPDGVQGGLAGGGHVGALELFSDHVQLFSDHVRFQRAFSLEFSFMFEFGVLACGYRPRMGKSCLWLGRVSATKRT